jgi:endonuclease/exonuclease/phosphatase family metal-dependent hydrolase
MLGTRYTRAILGTHLHSAEQLTTIAERGLWELKLDRRIDYIMVRCAERPTLHIAACRRLFDQADNGVWASDHFGVAA